MAENTGQDITSGLIDTQDFTGTDSIFNQIEDERKQAQERLHQERVNAQINQVNSGKPGIFNSLFRSVGIGATDFVNETDKTFGISNALKNTFGLDLQLGDETFLYETEKDLKLTPRNTFEALVATFTQFMIPFTGAVKVVSAGTKAAKLFQKSPKIKAAFDGIIAGAPVDAAVFDPNDPNAANAILGTQFLSENSTAGAFIKDYLATNPEDPEALNRARNAMMGVIGGVIGEGIVSTVGKTFKVTKSIANELRGIGDETTDTLADAIVRAKEGPDKLTDDHIEKLIEKLPDGDPDVKARMTEEVKVSPESKIRADDQIAASGKTAIGRGKKISTPTSKLLKEGTIQGRVLHHGAGRKNNPDRAAISNAADESVDFDLHHSPETKGELGQENFDQVISNFVLNVIPKTFGTKDGRLDAIKDIASSMTNEGEGFISVRGISDVPPNIPGSLGYDEKIAKGWEPFEDGWDVPKKGFQRGYTPEELKAELEPFFKNVEVSGDASVASAKVSGPIREAHANKGSSFDTPEPEPKDFAEHIERLSPEERAQAKDIIIRISKGEEISFSSEQLTDTGRQGKTGPGKGLARFVDKIHGPDEVLNLIKQISKELEDDLSRATPKASPDAETALNATLFGKTFKQYADTLVKHGVNMENAIPWNVSSRAVAAMLANKTAKATDAYLANPNETTLGKMLDAYSMTKVVTEGGTNLGTAAARNLASRKEIAKLEELSGFEDTLRVQLMNKVFYPTEEVAKAKAKQLKLLDKEADEQIVKLQSSSKERIKYLSDEEKVAKNITKLQKRLSKLKEGEVPDPKVKRKQTAEEKALLKEIHQAEIELGLVRERAPRKALDDAAKAEANIKRLRKQRERIESGEEPFTFPERTRELTDAERTELRYLKEASLIKLKGRLRHINQGFWSTTRDLNLEIFVNGLLSNTKTGIINFAGNATAIIASVFERGVAGLKNVDQSVDGVSISETAHMLRGYTSDSMFDLMRLFKKSFNDGPSDFAVKNDFIKPNSRVLTPETFGVNNQNSVLYKSIDFLGKAVNFPGKVLLTTDEVFKTMNYRGQIHALAQRGALKKAKEQGFDASMDGFAEAVQRYRTDLLQNPTEDMLSSAKGFAAENTFTNKLPNQIIKDPNTGEEITRRGFTRNFQRMIDTDRTGLMRTFVPFFQTPANLLFYASDRVPLLRRTNQQLMNELKSPDLAVKQLAEAKVATGMTVLTTGIALASGGYITGSAPTDPVLRQRYHDAGWKENSIITEDGYAPYARFDPLGILLSVSANMVTLGNSMIDITGHAQHHGYTREVFDQYMTAFADAALGTAGLVTDRHYLQGFAMLTDLITTNPGEFERAFRRAGGNLAAANLAPVGFYSSFRRAFQRGINPEKQTKEQMPSVVEEGDDFLDVAQKKTVQALGAFADDFLLSIPGWGAIDDSRYRPPKLDFVGQPTFFPGAQFNEDIHLTPSRVLNKVLTKGRGFANEFLNPAATTPRNPSPLINKIAELNLGVEGLHITESIKGVSLNNEERHFWEKTWGELNKERIEPRVKAAWFNQLPQNIQAEKLKAWLRGTKSSAKRRTLRTFPRVKQVLRIDRMNERIAKDQNRIQDNPLFNLGQQ